MVRLAFSVMIQVDAEILLIDEVLAVGDAAFQQKCFDEFERIRALGHDRPARHPRHGRGATASATARCCSSTGAVAAHRRPPARRQPLPAAELLRGGPRDREGRGDQARDGQHAPVDFMGEEGATSATGGARSPRRGSRTSRAACRSYPRDRAARTAFCMRVRFDGRRRGPAVRRRADQHQDRTLFSAVDASGPTRRRGRFRGRRGGHASASPSTTSSAPGRYARSPPWPGHGSRHGTWLRPPRAQFARRWSPRRAPPARSSTLADVDAAPSSAPRAHARGARRRERRRRRRRGHPRGVGDRSGPDARSAPTGARLWHLTWALAVTDFRLQFFGSALGYLWQLMRPLMLFGVLYVVFRRC